MYISEGRYTVIGQKPLDWILLMACDLLPWDANHCHMNSE